MCLPVALAVAWLLARREFWGKSLLSALVHLPLVLPPVVTGYLLLLTFGRNGAVGGFLEQFGVVFAFEADGHKSIASFARPDREFSVGEIEQLQRELRMVHDLLSDDEQPDLDEIKKIRAVSVALSQS